MTCCRVALRCWTFTDFRSVWWGRTGGRAVAEFDDCRYTTGRTRCSRQSPAGGGTVSVRQRHRRRHDGRRSCSRMDHRSVSTAPELEPSVRTTGHVTELRVSGSLGIQVIGHRVTGYGVVRSRFTGSPDHQLMGSSGLLVASHRVFGSAGLWVTGSQGCLLGLQLTGQQSHRLLPSRVRLRIVQSVRPRNAHRTIGVVFWNDQRHGPIASGQRPPRRVGRSGHGSNLWPGSNSSYRFLGTVRWFTCSLLQLLGSVFQPVNRGSWRVSGMSCHTVQEKTEKKLKCVMKMCNVRIYSPILLVHDAASERQTTIGLRV